MIYIFAALYCEAKPLIEKYGMKAHDGGLFGSFISPDGQILVILTGVGKTYSASALSYACARYNITPDDFVLNIGTAAGGLNRTGAYLINKVTDDDTGRTYYPDMIYNTGLRESAVTTVSNVATEETISSDNDMLWEMEASGFTDAARMFMPPHRVQLIKAVSDRGHDSKKDITDELLEETIRGAIDDITGALEVYLNVDSEDSSPMETDPELVEMFKCSETMKQDLMKLLVYCRNSGRDIDGILEDMKAEGIIPAPDRRCGKGALNELIRRVLQ